MGEVYRARDARLERDVAVKILSRRLERDPDALARFEREAKAVASLSHPNILAIHDFAIQDGLPYTVTELLEGESLRERLQRGPLPWRDAAEIGVAVAEGLSAAHAKGIVHRDLKPENLFVTREGRVKILDFGLARPAHEAWASARNSDSDAPTIATPTESGAVLGTIGYMSPEQARGLSVDTRSDLFSLGCVLSELVTGRQAFERATASDTLAAILNEMPLPLGDSGRHVPPELARVIQHCLEKTAERRFQSARDVAFALRAVLNDSSVYVGPGKPRASRRKAVAVLPFVNDSGNPELDFVTDGLTESVINTLVQIPKLRVIPRTLVFRYKGRTADPRILGAELNATHLVTGRIAVQGNAFSMQAEMIDVATEAQLWGHRFTRPMSDLFSVQEQLASEIAEALRGKLSRRKTASRFAGHKPDPEAYEHYLKGRYHWNRWTPPESFIKAIEHLETATTIDPAFALAWAGLADALGGAGYFGFLPAAEVMPRAGRAAERAIRLDDSLADGHSALGLGLLFWAWDFPAAERAFRTAIERNPRHALARVYHSLFLASQGRFDEAVSEAKEAERLDPVSHVTTMSVAWALHFAGRFEDLLGQIHHILDLDSSSVTARGMLVGLAEVTEDYAAAVEHVGPWLVAGGLPVSLGEQFRTAFAERGAQGYWEMRLALIERGAFCGAPAALAYADVYARLGREEEALDQLERAYDEHLGALVFLAVDRTFMPLRSHPRFQALCERIGLQSVAT
jgi:serine/threonine protein kinase/tetratricopeptide (TPR) repeat protein